MNTDVFISYHSDSSQHIVEAIVNKLEGNGIRCWYAGRHAGVGDYAASIMDALSQCRIFLLVLNRPASESPHVLNELEIVTGRLTRKEQVIILPFHVADEEIDPSAEYYINRYHWIDAMTPPLQDRINELGLHICAVLGKPHISSPSTDVPAASDEMESSPSNNDPPATTREPSPLVRNTVFPPIFYRLLFPVSAVVFVLTMYFDIGSIANLQIPALIISCNCLAATFRPHDRPIPSGVILTAIMVACFLFYFSLFMAPDYIDDIWIALYDYALGDAPFPYTSVPSMLEPRIVSIMACYPLFAAGKSTPIKTAALIILAFQVAVCGLSWMSCFFASHVSFTHTWVVSFLLFASAGISISAIIKQPRSH